MAYRSSAFENYVTSGTSSVNVPSGAASGDIVVVDVWTEAASSVTVTPASGFTIEATVSTSTGLATTMRRYWKRLTGSDSGSYSFTLSSNVPHMAVASAWSGRVASGSPFGTSGAATATYSGTGSGGGAVPGAVSAAAASAGPDAVLGIGGYNEVSGVSASGFTQATTNGDGQWLFYTANVSSGAPGSVTPSGPADYYVEILSLLLPAAGGSSFDAAGTAAAASGAALAVTATHVVTGTAAATAAASLAVTANHPVAGMVAATSAASLTAQGPGASGTAAAISGVSLAVTATHVAAGTVAAVSSVALAVTATHAVTGTVAGTSIASLNATGGVNPFPATVDASGRYLVTGAGQPWAMWIDSQWDLFCWGGGRSELGGGTTPHDVFDGYAAIQAANGFNATIIMAVNSNQGGEVGPYQNGRTWDGITPWGAGGIGDLNETYWARLDDLIACCGNHGITVYLELITSYTMYSGTAFAGLNTTNAATFGTAIGNRYKNTPNLIYCFGVDYFASNESQFAACLTAIRATGDTHLVSVEYMAESATRVKSDGSTGAFADSVDFDDVYSYNAAALEVRRSYAQTPARPTQFVNGHYYQGSSDNKLMDDLTGWALTSGSKGMFYGSEATWQWGSGAYAALSSEGWPNNHLPATIGWFTALPWHKLVPDLSSAFITSSRGTDATVISSGGSGGEYNASSSQNNYLTGAVSADGKLGLIYTPTSRTITIDTSKLTALFSAKWVDPANGSMTPVTAGSSYTHPGNNSAGHAGWYLLLQEVPSVGGTVAAVTTVGLSVTAIHAVSGTVAAATVVALTVTSNMAASGTVAGTSSVGLAVTATHVVAGEVDATSTASLNATLPGANGTVAAVSAVALAVTANLRAAGTISASAAASLTATITGQLTGTVAAVSTTSCAVTANLAATGTAQATSGAGLSVSAVHLVAGTVAAVSAASLLIGERVFPEIAGGYIGGDYLSGGALS